MDIDQTFSIVTGGENARVWTNLNIHNEYRYNDGFWIDDMQSLDAPDLLPTGEVMDPRYWGEFGPQQNVAFRT